MNRHAPLLLPSLLLALAPAARTEIPFEELGQAFLEEHCPDAASAADCKLDELVAASHATLRLGALELAFPLEYLGDQRRMEAPLLANAALDLQLEWLRRYAREPGTVETATASAEVLRAWIQGWSKSDLGGVAKGDGGDLLTLLHADDQVRKAAEDLAPVLLESGSMVWTPQYTERVRLLLVPTRREFMELVGYTGLVSPDRRDELWQDGVAEWTQFWVDKTLVLALEYAPWAPDPKFKTGLPMDKFDKDGLRQHFVQQAAGALLFTTLNRVDMVLFEKGLAVLLTIAVCGEANTIDGEGSISSTGGSTAPYERFVPGGVSSGGTLPAISAAPLDTLMQSRWREDGGEAVYLEALRDGQKAGAKKAKKDRDNPLAKNETAHFELRSESGKKVVATAPFLGAPAKEKPYPEEDYLNDLREFYRSYQASFLNWLRREGVPGDPEASEQKYRALLTQVALPGNQSIDEAVAEVYGEPLTTADASAGIEWRFLAWLAEQ
jgi:hypothetical protein